MRYSAAHKAESRARILESARTLFRREGFEAPSIDQVMSAAGLTRGAFYAHFPSKEALVEEVLDIEAGLVHELRRALESDSAIDGVLTALRRHLSPEQRQDVAQGCPLVAHPVDAIRGGLGRRERYETRFFRLVDALGGAGLTRDDAVQVAVLTVGAGLISAAVAEPDQADLVSRVCLDAIVEKLTAARSGG